MISFFVMALVFLAMIAGGAYAGFFAWRQFDLASLSQRNSAHMVEISVVLKANLWVDPQGVPRAPLGDVVDGDRNRLPSWLVGDDHTPWGGRYAWCPMSIKAGSGQGTAQVSSGPGSFYQASFQDVKQPGIPNEPYVVDVGSGAPALGGAAVPDVVGVLVSPAPYKSEAPDCSTVSYRQGYLVVDGGAPGSAVLIQARGTILGSALAGMASSRFDTVVYVAPTDSGDATGSDPSNAMTFSEAHALWMSSQPRVTTFVLSGGTHAVGAGDGEFRLDAPSRVVRFQASGGAVLQPPSGQPAVPFSFSGDMASSGLSFGPGVVLRAEAGARVRVSGGSVDALEVRGGSVSLDPTVSVASADLQGGELVLGPSGGRLAPAAVGSGVVAGAAPAGGSLKMGTLSMGVARLVVDGVDATTSGGILPSSVVGSQIALIDGGTFNGAASVDSMPDSACGAPDGYGRVACAVQCDASHPFVKQQACQGDGAALLSQGRVRDPATGVEAAQCLWRPDQPVAQKNVLVPGADGTAMTAQTSTAVDLTGVASFNPSAGGYCSMNP